MVKLVGDRCASDVSAALLNYKVQDGIVFFLDPRCFSELRLHSWGSLLFRLANCRLGFRLIYGLFS